MYTGRIPCEHEGMNQSDTEILKIPENHQKLSKSHGMDPLLQTSKGLNPADILILDSWPPDCEKKKVSIVNKPPTL